MARKRVITVSQLRCACLDPAWRERWCAGENPPTMNLQDATGPGVRGQLFHTLAEQFTGWLLTGEKLALATDEGAELWKIMYDQFAVRPINKLLAHREVPSAHHLSRSLENFCHRLADLRSAAGAQFRSWHDIFLTREYSLSQVEVVTPNGAILISGRPDAVRHVHGAGIEVVDYKLSRGSSVKEDLLQVAAYAYLLLLTKPGLKFSGMLEYYEPAPHLLPVSAADLAGIWNDAIRPVLGEIVAWKRAGFVKVKNGGASSSSSAPS